MMNRILPVWIALLVISAHGAAQGQDLQAQIDASRSAIKSFAGALQKQLKVGLQDGGPVHAIGICNHAAPEISAAQSEAHSLTLARTSLKTRNSANVPDAWELSVLQEFEARKAAGEDLAKLDHAEIVDGQFRYMKAIPTKQVCLTCHGQALAPDLIEKLDGLYPNDQARGFALGDIRGAFTITQAAE